MNFRDATSALLSEGFSIPEIARAVSASEASVRAARQPEDAGGYRKPPKGWEAPLAALADARAHRLTMLSKECWLAGTVAAGDDHEQETRSDAPATSRGRGVREQDPAVILVPPTGAGTDGAPGEKGGADVHAASRRVRAEILAAVGQSHVPADGRTCATGEAKEAEHAAFLADADAGLLPASVVNSFARPARAPVPKEQQTRRRKK